MTVEQTQLVEKHVEFARGLARKAQKRMGVKHADDRDEMESDAMVGLCKAALSYSVDRGAMFRTFARKHITGAVIDGMRAKNGSRRKVHVVPYSLQIHEANVDNNYAFGREHGPVSRRLWREMPLHSQSFHPSAAMEHHEMLTPWVRRMRPQLQSVVRHHFEDNLNCRETAERMDLSASRVSQLREEAATELRRIAASN